MTALAPALARALRKARARHEVFAAKVAAVHSDIDWPGLTVEQVQDRLAAALVEDNPDRWRRCRRCARLTRCGSMCASCGLAEDREARAS